MIVDEVHAALAARARLRGRPMAEIARVLAQAAARWREDAELARMLPGIAHLGAAMVGRVVPLIADALDEAALVDLHAREARGAGPRLVAQVLASNVPGLAVPAIAHAALAGAAVLVKSGRADTLSAPAFRRALAAIDPDLAQTVVTTYWPGPATGAAETAALARADVVVATGSDASVAAVASRIGTRLVAYGDRTSVAVVDATAGDDGIDALAWDVALYEQRGCLSPHVVFVVGGTDAGRFGERLREAQDRVAALVPPAEATTAERAARRVMLEAQRFAGARILEGPGGTIILGDARVGADPPGHRTVRVVAVASPGAAVDAIVPGTVECVGVAGVRLDADALRARGVARVCPVGRMQRPRIDWPRGQRPALGVLFRDGGERRIQVEP